MSIFAVFLTFQAALGLSKCPHVSTAFKCFPVVPTRALHVFQQFWAPLRYKGGLKRLLKQGGCVKRFYHVLENFSTPKIKGGIAKNV